MEAKLVYIRSAHELAYSLTLFQNSVNVNNFIDNYTNRLDPNHNMGFLGAILTFTIEKNITKPFELRRTLSADLGYVLGNLTPFNYNSTDYVNLSNPLTAMYYSWVCNHTTINTNLISSLDLAKQYRWLIKNIPISRNLTLNNMNTLESKKFIQSPLTNFNFTDINI